MAAKIKPAVPPGVGAHSKANRALIHPADNERITTNNIALRVILGGYKFEFVMGLRKKKKKNDTLGRKIKKGTVLEAIQKSCLRPAERTVPDAGVAVRRAIAIPRGGIAAADGICDGLDTAGSESRRDCREAQASLRSCLIPEAASHPKKSEQSSTTMSGIMMTFGALIIVNKRSIHLQTACDLYPYVCTSKTRVRIGTQT